MWSNGKMAHEVEEGSGEAVESPSGMMLELSKILSENAQKVERMASRSRFQAKSSSWDVDVSRSRFRSTSTSLPVPSSLSPMVADRVTVPASASLAATAYLFHSRLAGYQPAESVIPLGGTAGRLPLVVIILPLPPPSFDHFTGQTKAYR